MADLGDQGDQSHRGKGGLLCWPPPRLESRVRVILDCVFDCVTVGRRGLYHISSYRDGRSYLTCVVDTIRREHLGYLSIFDTSHRKVFSLVLAVNV